MSGLKKIRRRTRKLAFQALYQWHVNKQGNAEIERQFRDNNKEKTIDWELFHALFTGVIKQAEQLDASFAALLDRKVSALDAVELSILRLGSYELTHKPEMSMEVVINESVELTKDFGGPDSYKYINAVLDKLCDTLPLRQAEKRKS